MADEDRRIWLEEAMNRWETSLLRLCFAYLGDQSLAEDAVQETFLKAWKGYDRFRRDADKKPGSPASPSTYTGVEKLGYVLGTYTDSVKGNSAAAAWSHDGEDTSGGLDADTWGIEQLREMLQISTTQHEVKEYYWVFVNVETGVTEETLYDSGLNGNG